MYERKHLAYTTIMTVMNRLAVKGFLLQDKIEVPYVYSAKVSKVDVVAGILDDVENRILGGSLNQLPHGFVMEVKEL